jgi:hypothetical protein
MIGGLGCLAVLGACAAEPEAKYPESLGPCELLPSDQAIHVLDIGAKLGPPKDETSNIIVSYRTCSWEYKQPRKHFWSSPKPGPVERTLTIHVDVVPADDGGAPKAAERYESDRSSHPAGELVFDDVPGVGEAAFVSLVRWGEAPDVDGRLEFRRSNAVVKVGLSGRDCCGRPGIASGLPTAKHRSLLLGAARIVDGELARR